MMISDRECAVLCDACYAPARDAYPWDVRILVAGVRAFVKRYDGLDIVAFCGTDDIEGWLRDFAAIPITTSHPTLGEVHAGFYAGVEAATDEVFKALRTDVPYLVTGHSLGAAHAWLFSGAMLPHKPPSRIVCFGSPKPGLGTTLRDLFDRASVDRESYRNATSDPLGHDRVTDLPFTIEPELDWMHPEVLTDVAAAPPDAKGRWPWHAITLYARGVPG